MGVCNRQSLAQGKGVHYEVESEGSCEQNSTLRNTNYIRHYRRVRLQDKLKFKDYTGNRM